MLLLNNTDLLIIIPFLLVKFLTNLTNTCFHTNEQCGMGCDHNSKLLYHSYNMSHDKLNLHKFSASIE